MGSRHRAALFAVALGLACMPGARGRGPALPELYVDDGSRWRLVAWQSTRLPEP